MAENTENGLKNKTVLIFTRSMGLGGTENVILGLVRVLTGHVRKIIVCAADGVNAAALRDAGVTFYPVPDMEKKTAGNILHIVKTLKRIVKNEGVDIIHSHHRMAAFYVRISGLAKKKIHFIHAHNTFSDKRLLTRYSYRHSAIIAVGETVKRNLTRFYGLPETGVTVVRNAVPPPREKLVPVEALQRLKEEGAFLVGNVGRLSEQKGMEYFIRSLPLVKRSCDRVKYVVVGSGEREELLKKLAETTGHPEDIVFLGYRNDVRNVMRQLDLIVLSSLWEGFPLTPIEAFSVHKTVVATATDGTSEIVRDGVNGLLVPPRDSEAIAQKVIGLCNDGKTRERLEENAYEAYLKEYDFDRWGEKILRFYEERCLEGI